MELRDASLTFLLAFQMHLKKSELLKRNYIRTFLLIYLLYSYFIWGIEEITLTWNLGPGKENCRTLINTDEGINREPSNTGRLEYLMM